MNFAYGYTFSHTETLVLETKSFFHSQCPFTIDRCLRRLRSTSRATETHYLRFYSPVAAWQQEAMLSRREESSTQM